MGGEVQGRRDEWQGDATEGRTGSTKCVECKDEEKNVVSMYGESSPKSVLVMIGPSVCIKEWLQFVYQ